MAMLKDSVYKENNGPGRTQPEETIQCILFFKFIGFEVEYTVSFPHSLDKVVKPSQSIVGHWWLTPAILTT
jgi:hypothetical protein